MAGDEIVSALKSGAIDAAEWVGPWNDLVLKFHEAAKYYYYPGFHEPGTMLSVGLNLDLWNSLTQAQQTMITSACFTENDYMLGEFNAANGQALETLITEHNVLLRRFDDAIFADIAAVSRQVLEEVASADEMTTRVHASFTGAMEKLRAWTALSDQQYSAIRDLAFEKG